MLPLRHNSLGRLICRIDVAALAAVMFALLATFLGQYVNLPDLPRGVSVDMAKVSHPAAMPAALREDALEVAVTRDGKVWLGGDQVLLNSLPQAIRERVRLGAERKAYIRADKRARYGEVKQVLDRVRSAGIENIAFIVGERNPR